MNWENSQLSKLETNYTCYGVRFNKVQHELFFPENVPKFSEKLVLCNTSGQLFLNLQKILIVTTLYYPTCILEHGRSEWRDSQSWIFCIVERDDHVVRYVFVGRWIVSRFWWKLIYFFISTWCITFTNFLLSIQLSTKLNFSQLTKLWFHHGRKSKVTVGWEINISVLLGER